VPHARDLGFAPGRAAQVLAAIGGASIVGRIVMGDLGDRLGGKRALTISYLLLAGNLVWILFIENPWILFLFAPIYGFTHGAFFTLISPTVAEFFGTRSHGVIFAIVLLHGTIGGAMSPIIAGLVFDATGTYQPVFITLSVLAFTGLILINFVQKIPVSSAESNLSPCSQEH
jgi:MFS family permease